MIRALLCSLHSPDVLDLPSYHPPDPECFAFLLQLMVGSTAGPGEESFDVFVCTPQWFVRSHAPTEIVSGHHKLIVFEYDYRRLESNLRKRVEATMGETWEEVARKLERIGGWEFADYVEELR
ncbi:MAG: immunity 8 family protein [Acidobacteria bacterium]|nr:immunity 8 family protein [Acidobacteriota bacterium]